MFFREQKALSLVKFEREQERRRKEARMQRQSACVQKKILQDLRDDFLQHIIEPVCELLNFTMWVAWSTKKKLHEIWAR